MSPKPHTEKRRAPGARTWQEDRHEGAEVQHGVAQDRAEIVAFLLLAEALQGEAVEVVTRPRARDLFGVQPFRRLGPALGEVHEEDGTGGRFILLVEPGTARRRAGQQHLALQLHLLVQLCDHRRRRHAELAWPAGRGGICGRQASRLSPEPRAPRLPRPPPSRTVANSRSSRASGRSREVTREAMARCALRDACGLALERVGRGGGEVAPFGRPRSHISRSEDVMSPEAPQRRVALFFAVATFQPKEEAGVHDLGRQSGLAGQLGTVKSCGLEDEEKGSQMTFGKGSLVGRAETEGKERLQEAKKVRVSRKAGCPLPL